MSRLPQPGSDNGTWGMLLNDFLSVVHAADGTLANNVVTSSSIANNAVSNAKLDSSLQSAITKANTALQTVSKTDVGLGNVDNTSDVNKPVSSAQQTALNAKLNSVDLDSASTALVNNTNSNTYSAINQKIASATAGSTNIYILAPSDPDPTSSSPPGLYFRRTS